MKIEQEIECPHCRGQIFFHTDIRAGRTNFKIPSVTGDEQLSPTSVHKEEDIEL